MNLSTFSFQLVLLHLGHALSFVSDDPDTQLQNNNLLLDSETLNECKFLHIHTSDNPKQTIPKIRETCIFSQLHKLSSNHREKERQCKLRRRIENRF